jgi:hypothetical protein
MNKGEKETVAYGMVGATPGRPCCGAPCTLIETNAQVSGGQSLNCQKPADCITATGRLEELFSDCGGMLADLE